MRAYLFCLPVSLCPIRKRSYLNIREALTACLLKVAIERETDYGIYSLPNGALTLLSSQIIARRLPANEMQGIREMFKAIDEDGSGCITVDELREGLKKKGADLAFAEVGILIYASLRPASFEYGIMKD